MSECCNELQRLDYGKIGIVVFARKDMINNAIDTNTEPFRSMYYNYELNWTQTEALRLALWIASKAYPDLADGMKPIRIDGFWQHCRILRVNYRQEI